MNISQAEQNLIIIRNMIEKTRAATLESGQLLIAMGIVSALATLVIGVLEKVNHPEFVLPVLLFISVVNALIGYVVISRQQKNSNVTGFVNILFWNVWMAGGLAILICVFVFPLLNLYSFKAVPSIAALFMAVILFLSGRILEAPLLVRSAYVWIIGSLIMALTFGTLKFIIMTVTIVSGWVLPGIFLNRQQKKRGSK